MMSLFDELMQALPELTENDFWPNVGSIVLQNDADGLGDYIAEWNYVKPIPDGFKLGK